ncbi:MAG TPA: TauD/TfdA family dioxygenase [Streptosporangiaceae bacterium]|nr:TauD/TfdA family dioxygenase [Streptosporangiaceae bacterium]
MLACVPVAGRPPRVDAALTNDTAASWVLSHRGEIEELLLRHGCLVVSGLGVSSAADLAKVRSGLGHVPVRSREPFAPRQDFGDGVYSWPEWSAAREMCMHHEQGYATDYPGLLLMACVRGPAEGGALLLADTRRFLTLLPERLAKRLAAEGWLLRRNFLPRLGLGWREALDVRYPSEVAGVCAERDIEFEWLDSETLRLWQRRAAIVTHQVTGEKCAFSDLLFMSQWSIAKPERDLLIHAFGADGLPFNSYYGSGEELAEEDYWVLVRAYQQVTVEVNWQQGDVLIIDNVMTAHGREPYVGAWDIPTALCDRR